MGGCDRSICRIGFGKGNTGWEPYHCVGDTFGGSFFDVGAAAMVIFHCVADIPIVDTMGGPFAVAAWQFMGNNAEAGVTKGGGGGG